MWWDWQKQKPERLLDVSGPKVGSFPGGGTYPFNTNDLHMQPTLLESGQKELISYRAGFPPFAANGTFSLPIFPENFTFPGGPNPLDFSGPPRWAPPTPEVVVTDPVALDDVLNLFGTIGNLTIRDIMDIRTGSPLCYEYIEYKEALKLKPLW